MMQEALKYPVFCELIAQKKYLRPKTDKQAAATLLQTNRLIRPGSFYYSKAIGGKTGYHAKAKKNYVGAARFEGRTLIVVLLGYQDRKDLFQDAIKLFDSAFNQPKVQRTFLKEGKQAFTQEIPKASYPLQTYLKDPLQADYYPAEDPEAKCLLYWSIPSLPIQKDQEVGHLHLVAKNGEVIKQVPLLALNTVTYAWPYNWLAAIEHFFGHLSWIWVTLIGMFLFGILFFIWFSSPEEPVAKD
jgi:D-alanyl-D-alanine carboxypeptidase (penicillin-binding protein 5/6)